MVEAVDSAYPPSAAQVAAARAAGVQLWNGYIAVKAGVSLLRPWSQAEFGVVKAGLSCTPIAFCSGWDDPYGLKALAAAWGIRLCLDIESGIRDDGPWVDGFVAAAGCGIYGLSSAMYHAAPFKIVAGYPTSGDPSGASWPSWSPRPSVPCGWQWAGSHPAFGTTVDSEWLDDFFAGGKGSVSGQVANHITMLKPVTGNFDAAAQAYDWSQALQGVLVPAGTFNAGPYQYTEAVQVDGTWYDHSDGAWCFADAGFDTFGAGDPSNTPDKVLAQQQAAQPPAPAPAPAPPPAPTPAPAPAPVDTGGLVTKEELANAFDAVARMVRGTAN